MGALPFSTMALSAVSVRCPFDGQLMEWNGLTGQRERGRQRGRASEWKAIFSVGNLRPKRGKLKERRRRRSTDERMGKNRTASPATASRRSRTREEKRGGRRPLPCATNYTACSAPISLVLGGNRNASQLALSGPPQEGSAVLQ